MKEENATTIPTSHLNINKIGVISHQADDILLNISIKS